MEAIYDESGNLVNLPPQEVNLNLGRSSNVTEVQTVVNQLNSSLPGAQYIPDQYDRVWTHVKEAVGQLNSVTNYLWRAIYPGDINNRGEIALNMTPHALYESFTKGEKNPKRWSQIRIDDLPAYIHKNALERKYDPEGYVYGGIYGRSESGALKHFFYNSETNKMDSETVTLHPATNKPIQPGEVVWCGQLPKGWNKEEVEIDGEKCAPGTAPSFGGTRFTNYANADKGYFHLVRDLDLVIDYKERTREEYKAGLRPSPKIMIGGVPEDPHDAKNPDYDKNQPLRNLHSIQELEEETGISRKELQRTKQKFWNQEYKYAFYFCPNAERIVDPKDGKFRLPEFGDKVVAYDTMSRLVAYRHNYGSATFSSARNVGSSPTYLAGKTHFYIRNPHLVEYIKDMEGAYIDNKASALATKNQDKLYTRARKIALFIERTETGGGVLEPDGLPVEDCVYAIARGDGDMWLSGKRALYMTGITLAAFAVGSMAIGGLAFVAATSYAALSASSLVAIGSTSVAALAGGIAGGKFALDYGAIQMRNQFHKFESGIRTEAYKSALNESTSSLTKYLDQVWFSVRGLCVNTFTYFENSNHVENINFVSKSILTVGVATAVATVVAGLGAIAAPVMPLLAITSIALGLGGTGVFVTKMAEVGEKQFKYFYYKEASQSMDIDKIFEKRARDQYTRISPADISQRNDEHRRIAENYKEPVSWTEKVKHKPTMQKEKSGLASARQSATMSPVLAA